MVLEVVKQPLTVHSDISDPVFYTAGRLKALYRVSLADSIVLAEALESNSYPVEGMV